MSKRVEYSAVEARQRFSEITSRAHWGKERIKVFCRGRFVLAIVPPEDIALFHPNIARREVNSIREARKRFSEFIAAVQEGKHVHVYKIGKLYVVLVHPRDLEYLRSKRAEIGGAAQARKQMSFFKAMLPCG